MADARFRLLDNKSGADAATRETFLASLALALALTETVTAEAGDISLSSLLIEESFGSLSCSRHSASDRVRHVSTSRAGTASMRSAMGNRSGPPCATRMRSSPRSSSA